MSKYDTLRIQKQVERATAVVEKGVDGLYRVENGAMSAAKSLPSRTFEQKVLRGDAVAHVRARLSCQKNIKKYYPDGFAAPDETALERAENLPDGTIRERIEKKRAVRRLVNERSHYNRSVKVLLDARRMLKEKENYAHLEEIRENYEDAKYRTELSLATRREEIEKLEQQRREDIERRKRERAEKKNKETADKK